MSTPRTASQALRPAMPPPTLPSERSARDLLALLLLLLAWEDARFFADDFFPILGLRRVKSQGLPGVSR